MNALFCMMWRNDMKIENIQYIEIFERMQGMNKDEEWHFDFKLEKCQYRVENVVCPFRPKYNGTCVRITCTPFIRGKRYTMPSNLKAYENAIIPVWNLDSIVEFIEIREGNEDVIKCVVEQYMKVISEYDEN